MFNGMYAGCITGGVMAYSGAYDGIDDGDYDQVV